MLKKRIFIIAFLALSSVSVSVGGEAFAEGDATAGEQIYSQKCLVCHGPAGASVVPSQPILSAQVFEYLRGETIAFRDGKRHNPVMAPMAAGLSDKDIADVSEYLATQVPVIVGAEDMELAKQGEALYRSGDIARGIPACAACHGPAGAGIAPLYPRLSGQHSAYTASSLRAFADGQRRSDADVMKTIAARLSEDEINQLAEYISGLAN